MDVTRRWEDAIHIKPTILDFNDFWKNRLKEKRNILIITGLGWDPRMSVLPKTLKNIGGNGLRDLHLLHYKPSKSENSPNKKFINYNRETINSIYEKWGSKEEFEIMTRKERNLYVGDEAISRCYIKYDFKKYSDILVDISALPKSLYFTLLSVLVKKCDIDHPKMNIHVIACQDVDFDSQIKENPDDTRFLKGFKGIFNRLSQQQVTIIWVPVLEQNYSASLRKLHDYVNPKDVYPVLPFPSRNPRTDDNLLIEYRSIFVDEWYINPMNIIYSVEDDPLDVYRSLLNLLEKQKEVLEPLGGVSMVVSALSSKLSSIGVFMSAFEGNIAVAHAIGRHVPPENLDDTRYWNEDAMNRFQRNIHSIWLTGEPYEKD